MILILEVSLLMETLDYSASINFIILVRKVGLTIYINKFIRKKCLFSTSIKQKFIFKITKRKRKILLRIGDSIY